MTTAQLLIGVLFSSIGLGYFLYGKKQKVTVPLVCGLVLMIFPYFVENTAMLTIIGIILSLLPYFVRL
ncbi:amino acid transport protein [Acinetobacter sp. ANC 5380]|uniref:Amino acid transport protein n=1 Tax=Acinetobacter terrae TaxID=2731247 RepID=A0A7Y2REP0_9GAMM|nr:amino acid transport protein [Acinetobacter terrae]NNH77303.1 amino acid transport protein [Acinetobacter terrae]